MELKAKTLGTRLKELRESKGLLQKEVADCIGMTQRNYSKYESDGIVRPVPEVVKKFADFYGISVDDLLKKYNPLRHIPDKVMRMIQNEDSVPFLMEAYKQYQQYLEEKGK